MANRRMFSKSIVQSSRFLRMPATSRLLYYDLGMAADDDGYCEWYPVLQMTAAKEQDMEVLQANKMIVVYDTEVLMIKDWKENNQIRLDRYQASKFLGKYSTEPLDLGLPSGNQMATKGKPSIGKDSIGKDRLVEGENTPAQITKDFLSKGKYYQEYLDLFGSKNNREAVEKEFDKFILYWTESNGSGTKERWQQQPFEVKRRLVTWLGKNNNFNRPIKQRIVL